MSPLMSMTRAESPTGRTSKVMVSSGIRCPLQRADGAVFVVGDGHEVDEPGDLEDPAIVLGEPEGPYADVVLACLRQQADDQGDAGAVDVVDVLEVEGDVLQAVGG